MARRSRKAEHWVATPESSAIARIAFDRARGVLAIEFEDGDVYDYFDVPESVHREMLAAPSKGGFFAAAIRGVYRYERRATSRA